MKLYEINEEILQLMEQMVVDEETGEVPDNADEIIARINSLQMERKSVLEYLAKMVLNIRAVETALKGEESRLKERRGKLEKKEDRLLEIIDRECGGEKTDLGVATLSYRKVAKLEVSDAEAAVSWLKRNGYTDCFRTPAPEVAKAEVKRLIQSGVAVPGCEVVEDLSCSLK